MRCPSDQELAAWRERASRPADDACVRLVFVGRLARVKAVDLLLEALGQMARRGLSVRLDIVGDGAERPGLEDLVRDLGLGNTVRFVGQVPTTEVPGYLAAADVFVLCSHSEGMPYSLWEAMSFGLACVATRVGGVPELVTDGREGLLIEAGNPVALAEALGVLVRDPEQRLRLGQAARQRAVEKVRQQRSIPETLVAVYEQVLHQRSCTAQEAR
jgi:glycosyltransferase involved in cell wall biosynthesis